MIDDNGTYTLPKSFKELKEELGNKYDKYMYDMNLELLKELQKYKSAWNRLKERNLLLRTPDMRLLTSEMEEQEKIFNLEGGKIKYVR